MTDKELVDSIEVRELCRKFLNSFTSIMDVNSILADYLHYWAKFKKTIDTPILYRAKRYSKLGSFSTIELIDENEIVVFTYKTQNSNLPIIFQYGGYEYICVAERNNVYHHLIEQK